MEAKEPYIITDKRRDGWARYIAVHLTVKRLVDPRKLLEVHAALLEALNEIFSE